MTRRDAIGPSGVTMILQGRAEWNGDTRPHETESDATRRRSGMLLNDTGQHKEAK